MDYIGKLFIVLYCLGLSTGTAYAQSFPDKPITLVVGFPPGGSTDTLARLISSVASRSLPNPIVVENRPGASAIIATQHVKKARPDGYTLLVGGNIFTVAPHLVTPVPYDPVKDFHPIVTLLTTDLVLLVNGESPIQSMAELIALSKSRPAGLSYASSGIGTVANLLGEMFKSRTSINAVHVPFGGDAPAINSLLSKTVDFMFVPVSGVMGFIADGKLRPLAVASKARSTKLPNVPTTSEAGVSDLELQTWMAILAPVGLPQPVSATLHKAFSEAANSPEVRAKAAQIGTNIQIESGEDTAALIERQSARFAVLIKEAGIKPNQ